eukprot:jgi/Mesvir1/15650/Mv26142-RA.1
MGEFIVCQTWEPCTTTCTVNALAWGCVATLFVVAFSALFRPACDACWCYLI